MLQMFAQVVSGFADFALTGQEDQNVPALAALPEFVHAIGNGVVQILVFFAFKRAVAHLHRVGATGDHDDGCRAVLAFKVLGKAVGIDGGRCHHHFQIRALGQNLAQITQQKVDIQAALMRLVDDQRVVGFEQRVGLGFGQQNAVGHQLDGSALLQRVLKTHLVTDHLALRRVQLFGNALGHR